MLNNQNAAIMNLEDYGLPVGKRSQPCCVDARSPIEVIRLRPERQLVMAKGKVIAKRDKQHTELTLQYRPTKK